ncbi:MAG: anti-sigma factor [Hyphomicrobiales bacterium]|nr:anti-sigma factor [Hyphomicrobiales bacterium]
MTDKNETLPERDEVSLRAAELVLGLLSPIEADEVRREASGNHLLSAEISLWEEKLAGMADELHPVTPPPGLWMSIEEALRAETATRAAKQEAPGQRPARSLWNNIGFWRGLSFAGLGTAVAASIFALVMFWQANALLTDQDRLVVALQAGEEQAAFVATYDPQRKQIVIVPAQVINETERVPELWLVTKDKRVVSLGVIASESAQAVVIPPDLIEETSAGAGLVITLEPPGGAPGGVATGPAIAQGELAPI